MDFLISVGGILGKTHGCYVVGKPQSTQGDSAHISQPLGSDEQWRWHESLAQRFRLHPQETHRATRVGRVGAACSPELGNQGRDGRDTWQTLSPPPPLSPLHAGSCSHVTSSERPPDSPSPDSGPAKALHPDYVSSQHTLPEMFLFFWGFFFFLR